MRQRAGKDTERRARSRVIAPRLAGSVLPAQLVIEIDWSRWCFGKWHLSESIPAPGGGRIELVERLVVFGPFSVAWLSEVARPERRRWPRRWFDVGAGTWREPARQDPSSTHERGVRD
jgi:hypothetical protein